MENHNEITPIRSTETARPSYPDIGVCCPPWSKSLLKDLIHPEPFGDVDDDYQLVFRSTPYFQSLMQSYLDYIVQIYPCVDKLVFHWHLLEKGTGTVPTGRIGLEEKWNWFTPLQGGAINGSTNFFNQRLVESTWYTVETAIYTEGCNAFDGDCIVEYSVDYRWQLP